MALSASRMRSLRSGYGVLAALVISTSPAAAQTADPDAAATMRWGPLSMRSALALSNLGVDTNVFNRPAETQLPGDFTLTVTPTTNLWLRTGRTWIDGTIRVDWVYFNRYATERGANSSYRVGVTRTVNRFRVNAGASRTSTRDRPNFEIDARSQRFVKLLTGEAEYRVFGKTSFIAKGQQRMISFDKDAVFLGTSLASQLNEDTTSKSVMMRHVLTPLTTVGLEAGRENHRFFLAARNADSNRIIGHIALEPSALISGVAQVGYRHYTPWNRDIPPYRGPTLIANLTYRMRGTMRLRVDAVRELQQSFNAAQPYFLETGATWSVQQQVSGPFDVMGRLGRYRMAYRDRIGAVVEISKRVDRIKSMGGGAGYRFGDDKRVGFTVDKVARVSGNEQRRYNGLRYGLSITYER